MGAVSTRRQRKAEPAALPGRLAQLDAPQRADRNDQLVRNAVGRVRAQRDEAEPGLRAERLDAVPGAVGELDLDARLLDLCLRGELLDAAMDARDQIVERPRVS